MLGNDMPEETTETYSLIQPSTVRIASDSMRISADLIPDELRGKPLNFDAYADPKRKVIVLFRPTVREHGGNKKSMRANPKQVFDKEGCARQGLELHSWYSTGRGKSPQLAAITLYKWAGVKPPRKSRIIKAKVTEEGIEVRL